MVDKRDSYTKEDLEASGRGELFGAGGSPTTIRQYADDGSRRKND